MFRVRVKGEGVKLANKWCFINEEATIDLEEYERNNMLILSKKLKKQKQI